jgi:hypothetical protein
MLELCLHAYLEICYHLTISYARKASLVTNYLKNKMYFSVLIEFEKLQFSPLFVTNRRTSWALSRVELTSFRFLNDFCVRQIEKLLIPNL